MGIFAFFRHCNWTQCTNDGHTKKLLILRYAADNRKPQKKTTQSNGNGFATKIDLFDASIYSKTEHNNFSLICIAAR